MALDKEEAVRLAYQLMLGREPENDDVVAAQANFVDVYQLRNRVMTSPGFRMQMKLIKMADLLYTEEEGVRTKTRQFDSFIQIGRDSETRLDSLIREASAAGKEAAEYTRFHTRRFFDQVRAVVASRVKIIHKRSPVRLLDVGTAPVTRMYSEFVDDIELYTANIPGPAPCEVIAERFGAKEHYPLDLEKEDFSTKFPFLMDRKFDIIVLCEVVEHIRAHPQELLEDFRRITSAGGVLILSTPNGMSAARMARHLSGYKPDSIYRKASRSRHEEHHVHVREFTIKELEEAIVATDWRVLYQGVKDYYGDNNRNFIQATYMSSRQAQVYILTPNET